MDRNRKRKADGAQNGATPVKRLKGSTTETPESVLEMGLKLITSMKNAKDKTGRTIVDMFLTLPDKRELPDYYAQIKLPIAIDTVERKIRNHGYNSLTEIESDFKRMVSNAKQYNDDGSIIFADAERVRKMLHNWMKANNPAYKDPNYVAVATPIPDGAGDAARNGLSTVTVKNEQTEEPQRNKRPTITLSKNRRVSTELAADKVGADAPPGQKPSVNEFDGKSFGQVQEAILEEFIAYRDEEDMPIYQPFINLPSRSYTDYYQLIKKPVCLRSVAKKAKGQYGREAPTGISEFKTWDAFEEEVSFIWRNAQEYNEDGSDMFNLAGDFKAHFLERLAEVKSVVAEPPSARIKLNARPRPMLHLGAKASQNSTASPGVTVDNEALQRQKDLVRAGVNGHQTPQPPRPESLPQSEIEQTSNPPVVKTETAGASPAPEPARVPSVAPDMKAPTAESMMPPPRIPSSSPHPAPVTAPIYTPSLAPATATFGETFARTKPVSEALLPNIHLETHPNLSKVMPFKTDIRASPAYVQHSITVQLAASQYALQATPTVSQQLSSGRQYKLFITANGVRLSPTFRPLVNGELTNGAEKKQTYDISLVPGVNRIEVEIVAVTGRGGTLEMEKTIILANLMRH